MTRVPAEEVLSDWEMLRNDGVDLTAAAVRLGLTKVALEKRLERALARGDSRGARQPFGRDFRPAPRHVLPLGPGFPWRHNPTPRRATPCVTCGAPIGACCVTSGGHELRRGHRSRNAKQPPSN